MIKYLNIIIILVTSFSYSQVINPKELSYNEYLGYVKKYHPLVKKANLEINKAQANLMMARGAFDPKIEVDYSEKKFKNKEYYSILNSSFKIPTWYGIDIKAAFDNSEGVYLNPDNTLPNQGLTSLGIAIPLGQGLFTNQRMAELRKAKSTLKMSDSERKIAAILVLYDASIAYFNWKKNTDEVKLYLNYVENASKRFDGIKTLISQGDKPAIDSVEASIILKNRLLSLEDAKLKLAKSKLDLENYLWLENNTPIELEENINPENKLNETIEITLKTNDLFNQEFDINNHPKIEIYNRKIEILNIDKKLKSNQLLPKIDLNYAYISEPSYINNYNLNDYKIGLNFNFPLFLRKERGSLKLAKFKIQETQFALEVEKIQLNNKIKAQKTEIRSIKKQNEIINSLVKDNTTMLASEEKLFNFGESSLFLINTRENNLVSAQLAQISLENRYYISHSELFKSMANPD